MNLKNKKWMGVLIIFGLVLSMLILYSFLKVGRYQAPTDANGTTTQIWTCSMHPQVRLPKPGKCPICSMDLIPVKEEGKSDSKGDKPASDSMLTLSEHARAMASVETERVMRRKLNREIRSVGKIQYNETSLSSVVSRVDGYVERLYVDYVGIEVKAGDHLVEIYSPDLVIAQKELLLTAASGDRANLETVRTKLMRLGLTQQQVDELIREKKIHERITLYAPIKGTVIEKLIVEKSAVKNGDVLYRLANLESVWVYLDIYEYELEGVQTGRTVEIRTEAYPADVFTGRIWFVSPTLNEETRTIKALVNIDNAEQKLKPGMFVNAIIQIPLLANGQPGPTGTEGQFTCPMHPLVIQSKAGQCPLCGMNLVQIPGDPAPAISENDFLVLAVPVTSVLDSGMRKIVYIERAQGEFEPVEVTVGPRAGSFYPVIKGLTEEDKVAVRGNFLLDSQSQIRGLPSLFYKEGEGGVIEHQHGGVSTQETDQGSPKATNEQKKVPQSQEHKH